MYSANKVQLITCFSVRRDWRQPRSHDHGSSARNRQICVAIDMLYENDAIRSFDSIHILTMLFLWLSCCGVVCHLRALCIASFIIISYVWDHCICLTRSSSMTGMIAGPNKAQWYLSTKRSQNSLLIVLHDHVFCLFTCRLISDLFAIFGSAHMMTERFFINSPCAPVCYWRT